MSDSSKPLQRPGATPIKNPLLSASVTGLTFDDFPNKPLLLPAAPPIVHAPPPTAVTLPTAAVTPSALLGRVDLKHKTLVTVGSSSLDTENLDEINLNSSNEDSGSDPNANQLLEQTPATDSILSQAASSFSALPSVASNVFSSFSKRITAISSRETTPVYDQQSDANANYGGSQLDIQPTYIQKQVTLAPEPFYAPPPAAVESGNYFGSLPPPSSGLADTQNTIPAVEPPKFYTPADVTTLPTASVNTPPIAGGQNNFRLAAKKKLYAPIPGLSDQNQPQPIPAFNATAISAPISHEQPPVAAIYSDSYAQSAYQQEERKQTGGLFSKITNLAPTGVLQNITGLVQSAAGSITQTIKPESAYSSGEQQHYQTTAVTFDQQQKPPNFFTGSPEGPAANYFSPPPIVGQEVSFAPPPTLSDQFQQAPLSAGTFFNPPSAAEAVNPTQPAAIPFFDPSKSPAPPALQPGSYFQDPYQQIPLAPPPSAASSQPSRPPSHPSRPPSQPGLTGSVPIQTPPIVGSLPPSRPPSHPSRPSSQPGVQGIFSPQQTQVADENIQPVSSIINPAINTRPPQVNLYDPTKHLPTNPIQTFPPPSTNLVQTFAPPITNPVQTFGVPPTNPAQHFPPTLQQNLAPPPTATAAPPPQVGYTSFRLQKGTRLYKNPLTAQETAPVQVTPNQISAKPPIAANQQSFVPPSIPQNFATPPLASSYANNFSQVPQAPPKSAYNFNATQHLNQTVASPPLGSNFFVPLQEPQSVPLIPTAYSKPEEQKISESIPLFSTATGEVISATEQSVALFAAPIEETINKNISLEPPATEEIQTEEQKRGNLSELHGNSGETEKQQLPPEINPAHFFKPIEPVTESTPQQQADIETSSKLHVSNENNQEFFKPIEPVVEEQKPDEETHFKQQEPITSVEESLQNLNLAAEKNNISTQSELQEPPSSSEPVQNLSTVPIQSNQSVDPKSVPLVPPPSIHSALGVNNPYRRGSATETTKPVAAQSSLANFFTPGPSAGAGDFNFFSSLTSDQTAFEHHSTQTDFFSSQPSQQPQIGQQFFDINQSANQDHLKTEPPQANNQTQAINFFGVPTVQETNSNLFPPSNLKSADLIDKTDKVELLTQQSSTFFGSAPYPCDNSLTQGEITSSLPPLPVNIGLIPSAQESTEDIQQHQADISIQGPPPPIGFENFIKNQNPSSTTESETVQQQIQHQADNVFQGPPPPIGFEKFIQNQIQSPSAEIESIPKQIPIANTQTTQKLETTTVSIQQQQPVDKKNFSNYFNQNSNSQPDIPKDPSSFFDSFAGHEIQHRHLLTTTAAPPSSSSNEDQRIQNFFNNPPPKDAYHAGDLNYDLIHSGLAIRNLQQRSLTPASNLVEPPSSACSEFSNLTLDQSNTETSFVKEEIKANETTTDTAKAALPFYNFEDLNPETLELLGMANLVQGSDKAPVPQLPSVSYKPVVQHWFYKRTVDTKQIWTPFSHYDSALLETSLTMEGEDKPSVVAVEGGRYDANIGERLKRSVYWESEPIEIRRCSWFYKASDSNYIPYEESTAEVLETEYKQAAESGVWHKTVLLGMGEQVQIHGPTVIVHYQQQQNQDAWGGTTQTTTRPRIVKRDLDDFRIEQGESQKADHLLFMVHGIGSGCDLKLRPVEEVVDDFRSIAHQLVLSHYKNSSDLGLVGRVEVLPISWHNHLHSLELGIDEKLRSITLESIPKLRNLTNDTLLDILFYTSPTFAQRIMNSIVMSLNSIYMKYRQRHPDFSGGVSLAGHSLGSLILFDLLCHQNPMKECEEKNLENPDQQFAVTTSNGEEPMSMDTNQIQSRQIGYTMGPAGTGQPFIHYGQLVFQPKKFFALGSPIGMFVTIRGIDKLGLDFRLPTCAGFYNIFHPYDPVAYRIEALVNPDLSGCRPVLIPHHKGRKRMHLELKETMARVSTDLKNKFLDKFKTTFESVNFFGGSSKSKKEAEELMEKEVEKVIEMQIQLERQDQPQSSKTQKTEELPSPSDEHLLTPPQNLRSRTDSVSTDDMVEIDLPLGKLNDSKRIDYVLQEAPLEFINEYLFALSSHVCYWDSEDTILFVMKEIYAGLGISPDSQVPQQTMTIERPSSRNSLSNA